MTELIIENFKLCMNQCGMNWVDHTRRELAIRTCYETKCLNQFLESSNNYMMHEEYKQYIILFISILITILYSDHTYNLILKICYVPVYLAKQFYSISLYLVNYNENRHDINHTINEHRAELNEMNDKLDKLNNKYIEMSKYKIEMNDIRNRLHGLEDSALNFKKNVSIELDNLRY